MRLHVLAASVVALALLGGCSSASSHESSTTEDLEPESLPEGFVWPASLEGARVHVSWPSVVRPPGQEEDVAVRGFHKSFEDTLFRSLRGAGHRDGADFTASARIDESDGETGIASAWVGQGRFFLRVRVRATSKEGHEALAFDLGKLAARKLLARWVRARS